jgi:Flp pilus assembly protein TadB
MEVSWPVVGSWSLFACCLVALAAWWLVERKRRKKELQEKVDRAEADVAVAREAYEAANRNGSAADLHRAALDLSHAQQRHNDLKKQLAALLVAVVVAGALLCGCATRDVERVVLLDDHVRIVAPGDVVPDYAPGESRWWLMSPRGLSDMLPKEN